MPFVTGLLDSGHRLLGAPNFFRQIPLRPTFGFSELANLERNFGFGSGAVSGAVSGFILLACPDESLS
jgi:hypothetical protein